LINKPILICEKSFQIAWAKVINELQTKSWEAWNVVVQIEDTHLLDKNIDNVIAKFAKNNKIILPKHVAHTIFPQTFFINGITRENLYYKYWRFYNRPRKKLRTGWGTYFNHMIKYTAQNGDIDQLGSIIDNINNRDKNYGASYFMIIPRPDRDLNKIMGAPCLNYITIQTENTTKNKKVINLLAVYRNHDFTKRAYGNYLGLCHLLNYIAYETKSKPGVLTCISSHATVSDFKKELFAITNSLLEVIP